MDWNNTSFIDLLQEWRDLRNTIKDLPKDEAIYDAARFWASAPIAARIIDYYEPESWPLPWDILYNRMFCRSSISLMIYYTLCHHPEINGIEMYLIDDEVDEFLVPVVTHGNDKFILNYELGTITNVTSLSDVKFIKYFGSDELPIMN